MEEVIHTLAILVSALVQNFELGLRLGPGLDNFPTLIKSHFIQGLGL